MKLKKLLAPLQISQVKGSREVEISGISSDSRTLVPGNLFVARRGLEDDGSRYIPKAIASGAAAIVTDLLDPSLKGVTQIVASDLRKLEADLAAEFYGHPSHSLFTVGITGTNGKTSSAYFVKHLLDALGLSCGLCGTIEVIAGELRHPATHTTPDATTTHKLLREMVREGCRAAVLEVSSHGLDQERTRNVAFNVALFTNLTQDHLDYHGNMEAYRNAKMKLMDQAAATVVNIDDPEGEAFLRSGITYGFSQGADLRARDPKLSLEGTTFRLEGHTCTIPHIGRFNVLNWLGAIGVARLKGFPLDAILPHLPTAPQVPGRLERVTNQAFVDYAHTPDALSQVLQTLRPLTKGRLIVVFGCGGDRDQSKRPQMGQIARKLADIPIITSDNPRTEDPQAIITDIERGAWGEVTSIVDRKEAISHALTLLQPGDTLLVAGKGHETYQIIGRNRLPFDDRQIIRELTP